MSADLTVYSDIGDGGTHVWLDLNITYNLSPMLAEAGFKGWTYFRDKWVNFEQDSLHEFESNVRETLEALRKDPKSFRLLNPMNGWGTYEDLLQALQKLESIPWHRSDLQLGWSL